MAGVGLLHWYDEGLVDATTVLARDAAMFGCTKVRAQARFYRATPCVSLGACEQVDRVVRGQYVREHNLPIIRRATGGGTLYLDPGTEVMALVIAEAAWRNETSLSELMEYFGFALSAALMDMGVRCAFVHPNDLVQDGMKIASAFVTRIAGWVLFEAVVLIEIDIEAALKAIRLPLEKLSPAGLLAASRRFLPLCKALGEPVDRAALRQALVTAMGQMLGVDLCAQVAPVAATVEPRPAWPQVADADTTAFLKTTGGVSYVDISLSADDEVIAATFATSAQVAPNHSLLALAAALAGIHRNAIEHVAKSTLATLPFDAIGLTRGDLQYLLHLALEHERAGRLLGLTRAQARRLILFSPNRDHQLPDLLERVGALLLPYCAKPTWCAWRARDGCPQCGGCEVGTAYQLGEALGLPVISIINYEFLRDTLAHLRRHGVEAIVGACCTEFFLKRDYAFSDAGMAAVLIDISGDTCYTLRQEEAAYAGQFSAETTVDIPVLTRVLKALPTGS